MKVETTLLNQLELIPETSADKVILSHMTNSANWKGKIKIEKLQWIDKEPTFSITVYESLNE